MKVTQIFTSALKSAPAFIGSSVLAAGVLALSAPVNAATLACPEALTGLVSGTSACAYSDSASQDFLNTNPMTVNSEAFFGFTDWAFSDKLGENFSQSGTWDVSSLIQSTWSDAMLIFKSGQGTTLVGYLLQDGVTSGSWDSPFLQSVFGFNGGDARDVSHISVYYRQGETTPGGTEVPEPGSLAALAVAAGFVVSRGRKALKNA